jgi:hypothetical protein
MLFPYANDTMMHGRHAADWFESFIFPHSGYLHQWISELSHTSGTKIYIIFIITNLIVLESIITVQMLSLPNLLTQQKKKCCSLIKLSIFAYR